jgi:hypothetical protein
MPIPGNTNYAMDVVKIESPVNDALPFVIVLPPHLEGDPWGVNVIFYGIPIGRPAAAGEIRFYHFSDTTRTPSLVLPAAILNAAAWTFTIPQVSGVVFNLDPVLWFWSLVETSEEEDVEVAIGHLVVRHKDQ